MPKSTNLSLPIQITFDLTKDRPETSGLMTSLRKKGFEQKRSSGTLTKWTFKGDFTGTLDDLKDLCRSVKQHRTKD